MTEFSEKACVRVRGQFAERAIQSQPSKADAEQRARHFKKKYTRRLRELKDNPW